MSRRSFKFGLLLVLALFCVSELGRFRPLLAKSPSDVCAGKQFKEAGGVEEGPSGFALSSGAMLELVRDAQYCEAHDLSASVGELALTSHHLRGPPQLATF